MRKTLAALTLVSLSAVLLCAPAGATTLTVQSSDASAVGSYRWLLEEDTTHEVTLNTPEPDSLGLSIHASYAPVLMQGTSADLSPLSSLPSGRYFITVYPDSGFTIGGGKFNGGDPSVTVTVNPWPVPTAQISVFVYEDNTAISGAPELPAERGLAGFNVRVAEILGHQYWDAFGNPLGTTYLPNGDVDVLGSEIFTDENGRALITNLPAGKYAVTASPRDGSDWVQTTSIGGTPAIPVVVKAGEPAVFTQGGPGLLNMHAFIGFVKPFRTLASGPGTITGRCTNQHTAQPPSAVIISGAPVEHCYVGVNIIEAGTERGVLMQAADPTTGQFTLTNIPAGTYQVTAWDRALDNVMNIRQATVTGSGTVALGDIPLARWVATFEGSVFRDVNENGMRDVGEVGIPNQAINIRYRDASMIQTMDTDVLGSYSFKEVPILGKWLVTEVDFGRFKVTGATTSTDQGGNALPALNTDLGLVLLEGMIINADQINKADWGKTEYGPGADNVFDTADDENGGIAGIIYYASTRAENDPRLAAADDWEPGIPRVQVALYQDSDGDGVVDDINGLPGIQYSDVDNHPLGNFPGPEDVDRNYPGQPSGFQGGDAIQVGNSDSFDDNLPTGCVGPNPDCRESLLTWNQMRIALFDGGWQYTTYVPGGVDSGNPEEPLPLGTYIAEVALPPGYELVKEEDLNVLSGNEFSPTPQLLPPPCVGDGHMVPPVLSKDGVTPAPFAGDLRRLCDRKQVTVSRGQNAVCDFHLFTQTPKAGRIVGTAVNPFAVQTNPADPNFGSFLSIPFIPISIRDYLGNEITRVYTDAYGAYNALVPSTVDAHVPQPSGYSAGVHVICANSPSSDPQYNPNFDQPCLPIDVMPGKTTYVPTNLNAIAAFQSSLTNVDCELPDGTPVISEVNNSTTGGPWVTSTLGDVITITSPGTVMGRDYGFEASQGSGKVTLNGVVLAINSWSNTSIEAVVPAAANGGPLTVFRNNGQSTVMDVTVTVENAVPTYVTTTIQDAIDAAPVNGLVLVPPGTYQENLIISKPVRLQGYGAYSTIIDASAFETNKADWTARLDALITGSLVDTVPGQRLDLSLEDGAAITVLAKDGGPNVFTAFPRARVDGFTITGATRGGGVFLNGYVHSFEVSNNRFTSNQGMFAGALRSGWQSLVNDTLTGYERAFNDDLYVHDNHFDRNGSLGDGGAMAFYNGTDAYQVTSNYICGNYSALNGGGISHFGNNLDGAIVHNQFLFNEAFGEGGGVQMTGEFVPAGGPLGLLGDGTGSALIYGNLFQGNYVGDDGGAISLYGVNGLDVATNQDDPTQWYHVDILNNRVVNNVSAFAGGGISLSESVDVRIVHNTIANNDSTSVANFGTNSTVSQPAGGGIVARGNSPGLVAASGVAFSNPLLVNDIIHHNRSLIWDQNANGGLGALIPDPTSPYWDLEVFGQPAGVGMDPRFCVLSADALGGDPHAPAVVYDASNVAGDPDFNAEYLNVFTITPGPIPTPTFTPLAPTGDYDIGSASVARNAGDSAILGPFGSVLTQDFDGDDRPRAVPDIGADEFQETVAGGGGDVTGPTTYGVQASPNPTGGAASVSVTATVSDAGTGGSAVTAAEWWRSTDPTPAPGAGTAMSGAFGSVTVFTSASVPVPGGGDFTVFVRGRDANGNWGPAAALLVYDTGTPTGDVVGPKTDRTKATPNPTEGAVTVTVTAIAYDTVTGGNLVAAAEWWTGADPGAGSGAPMTAVDGVFDEVAENVTATVPVPLAPNFTVFMRSQDDAGNWGAPTSVFVSVTSPGQGSGAPLFIQCPGVDADGDALVDGSDNAFPGYFYPNDTRCMHITGGDGFINMGDDARRRLYMFGFSDVTGVPAKDVLQTGILAANFPAPTITVDEGDEFYLNLTNVGMMIRPDLFDPHSVHWHGFPQAAAIFDGVPEASVAINMGSTLTYYYNVIEPGTYMWHCHVEATEHMQMGMLGNLYVRPKQNRLPDNYCFATQTVTVGPCAGHKHANPDYNANRNLDDPAHGDKYAYNDGDGSTYYDVEYPIQIGSMDPDFHDASEGVQPLPFALMLDKFPMLNGRGYPDTMNPSPLLNTADEPKLSQKVHSKIDATAGQKILLRISNLNVTRLYTLATLGIPMKVVGVNARLFRGPSPDGGVTPGKNLYYDTNSVTLGGGEAVDVIIDTTGVTPPAKYFLYTTNLAYLTNNDEQYGGMMTEINITP
jgi:hypothetical protein